MRIILYGFMILVYTALMSRHYYIQGLQDANFDRERANLKLQQCQDVIKNEKI
jgi:hypothetical protein